MSGTTNEKNLAACNDQAPGTTNEAQIVGTDGLQRKAPASDADRKRQAELQARAALAGIALHRLADGSWLAHKWNLSKPLADHEVEAWLVQVGAR